MSLHCNFVVFGYSLFGEAKESDLQRAPPATVSSTCQSIAQCFSLGYPLVFHAKPGQRGADYGVESLGAIPAFKPLQFICRLVANHCLAVTMRALWVIYNTLLNQSNSGRLTFSSIQLNSHLTALQRRQPPQLSNQFRQFTFTYFSSHNSCARSSDTCRYCIASECN